MNMKTNLVKQKQTFTFKASAATSVLLAADFTHWQTDAIPLAKQPNGIWSTTIPLDPGTYHYRFLVDGEWYDDPQCTLRVTNPFGTQDSVLLVAAPEVAKSRPARPVQALLQA